MAYVPPHRRKKDGSEKREYYYPDADDDLEEHAHRIWFAVDANVNPRPNLELSFKPFADASISHSLGNWGFALSVDDVETDMRYLVNNETPPWRYTSNKIKDELRKCFHILESCVKKSNPNYAKPAFTARFGNIIFHGSQKAWLESIALENLEKIFNGGGDSQNRLRTFDTNIRRDIFDAVKQKAIMNLSSPTLKEKVVYLIIVRDDLKPGYRMVVTCRKKEVDDKQIELKKVELLNLRHFLVDTSCLHKLMDWRLSVTEKYLIDLDEEDKECIEGIVKSARIEVSAKGGLVWPPGGSVRKTNRFHVRRVWNLNVTTIVGEKWDIKFQHADRIRFVDWRVPNKIHEEWKVSNEIDLKLKSISKYLRERRPWEEENIMNILEDNLKWVWMEALS